MPWCCWCWGWWRRSSTSGAALADAARDAAVVAEARITFVCIGRDGAKVPVPAAWREIIPRWSDDAPPAGG